METKKDKRFDNRSKDAFKKDIYFGTAVESYWWDKLLVEAERCNGFGFDHHRSNGCGNDGRYLKTGTNTGGADYYASGWVFDQSFAHGIEVKWVSSPGRITLKKADVDCYLKEGSGLYIIQNIDRSIDLRKPKGNHNIETHLSRLDKACADGKIVWSLMLANNFACMMDEFTDYRPIKYMGNKQGVVIQDDDWIRYASVSGAFFK
jgi:hypothetical protein